MPPKRKKNDRVSQAERERRGELERYMLEILDRGDPELDVENLVYLDSGISSMAFGAQIDGVARVVKMTEDGDTMLAADGTYDHYARWGEPPKGVANVIRFVHDDTLVDPTILDQRLPYVFIQERAMLVRDLDRPRHPKVCGYAAPLLAESLEDAVRYLIYEQHLFIEELEYPVGESDEKVDPVAFDDLDDLARTFARQLLSGAHFLAEAMEHDPEGVVYDWAMRNVGIVERDGEPHAVVIDLGIVM